MCSHHSSPFFLLLLLLAQSALTANGTKFLTPIIYKYDSEAIKNRPVDRPIHPFILARRSIKHMNGKPIPRQELMSLFEAARWAPSAFNLQVWRFVYAERDGPFWEQFLDLLSARNKVWAKDAAVLVVVLSANSEIYRGEKRKISTHSFDAGAAWMAMALEGTARGLVVHATGGYNPEKVAATIGLQNDDDYTIEAILAIGNRAYKGTPESTTQRKDIDMFVSEGVFEEKLK